MSSNLKNKFLFISKCKLDGFTIQIKEGKPEKQTPSFRVDPKAKYSPRARYKLTNIKEYYKSVTYDQDYYSQEMFNQIKVFKDYVYKLSVVKAGLEEINGMQQKDAIEISTLLKEVNKKIKKVYDSLLHNMKKTDIEIAKVNPYTLNNLKLIYKKISSILEYVKTYESRFNLDDDKAFQCEKNFLRKIGVNTQYIITSLKNKTDKFIDRAINQAIAWKIKSGYLKQEDLTRVRIYVYQQFKVSCELMRQDSSLEDYIYFSKKSSLNKLKLTLAKTINKHLKFSSFFFKNNLSVKSNFYKEPIANTMLNWLKENKDYLLNSIYVTDEISTPKLKKKIKTDDKHAKNDFKKSDKNLLEIDNEDVSKTNIDKDTSNRQSHNSNSKVGSTIAIKI